MRVLLDADQIEEIEACLFKKIRDLRAGVYGRSSKIEGISIPKWIADIYDILEILETVKRRKAEVKI